MDGWVPCCGGHQVTLGEIMSVFGVCTMLSEALLVRVSVPYFGEKASMQIGR